VRKVLCLAAMAMLAATSPANADTVAAAIEGFGLIGTWSSDCTKDVSANQPGFRMIFAEPPGGAPNRTTIGSDGKVKTTVHTAVLAAARVADDQLKLTLRIIGGEHNGGPLPDVTTNTFEQVIETVGGNRILVAGADPEFLKRCRN
jgi:hypothetical protein